MYGIATHRAGAAELVAPAPRPAAAAAAAQTAAAAAAAAPAPVQARYSAARGKALYAARDIAPGDTLWRERPVAALQYADSRQSGTLACRDSLRFVGTMAAQLQVMGQFSEAEQLSGAAEVSGDLAAAMARSAASARLSGGFLQLGDGSDELFGDATAKEHASASYYDWMAADAAAWANFREHALETNETFILAAQLLARYFVGGSSAGCGASGGGEEGERAAAGSLQTPAEVLEGLISGLWWELPSRDEGGGQSHDQHEHDHEDGDDAAMLDVATSRRELLEESFEKLQVVAAAAGCAEVTLEMYGRLIGALELNSIAIEIQSPLAVFLEELSERFDAAEDGERAEATRVIELVLPHIERRLKLILASDAEHEEDDEEGAAAAAAQPPPAKRARSDISGSAASLESTSRDRLRQIAEEVGGLDQLYPPLYGVGLFEGVANLNHACRPNAVVVFEQDALATVAALKPIRKGEEVTICYIEEDQPVEERRADLVDYGFLCDCVRCTEETTKHA